MQSERERREKGERKPFLVTSAWITSLPHSWTWNVKEKITPQTCNTGSRRQIFFFFFLPALHQEVNTHYTLHIHSASEIPVLKIMCSVRLFACEILSCYRFVGGKKVTHSMVMTPYERVNRSEFKFLIQIGNTPKVSEWHITLNFNEYS